MLLPDAIRLRIIEIIEEKNISVYKLSYMGGISPSNISDILREKVNEPTLSTVLHICEGANLTLKEFFDSDIFNEVEAVEKPRKIYKNKSKQITLFAFIFTIYEIKINTLLIFYFFIISIFFINNKASYNN